MTALNHTKQNARDLMGRARTDRINDFGLPGGLTPPRQRPSKADQRAEAQAAIAAATRTISCACGHSARVPITARMRGRRFSCSKCGSVIE
ncbi:hypothetical protein [Agrobacterium larrymoorei]|uniref:Transposase n=1 Tax=Agrobacterium larrymoorei TaxID=160699 RepID=A0ABU0UID1_9HYPH|nr:hypothetical protein [Agrobacterium larrymoorei]MDQ1184706.1 hypothetical protein [Agrobacterium larrymoorei]